jgi:hypothetical protein
MKFYIAHYIKEQNFHSRAQYNRLSDLYESVKPLCIWNTKQMPEFHRLEKFFDYKEGTLRVNQLKATYPELDFELKYIGD